MVAWGVLFFDNMCGVITKNQRWGVLAVLSLRPSGWFLCTSCTVMVSLDGRRHARF